MTEERAIGDGTPVKMGLVVTFLIAAASAGASYVRIGAGEARLDKADAAISRLQEQAIERDRATALDVQALKLGMDQIQLTLKNIERQLERMNGTRQARGNQ